MRTIGVIGSRRRALQADFRAVRTAVLKSYIPGDEFVSGGCPQGGDAFAERLAKSMQVPIKIYYAEWQRLGICAGFAQNRAIARHADILIACVAEDRTGGTEDTIRQFLKKPSPGELILC